MTNLKERNGVFEFGISYCHRSIFADLGVLEFSAGRALNKRITNNACEIVIEQFKKETIVYIASEAPEIVEFLNNKLKRNKRLFWYIIAVIAENVLITRNRSFYIDTCKGFSGLEFIDEYNKALSRLEALREGKVSDYYYNSMIIDYDALPNYVFEFKDCMLANRFGITEDNEEISVDDIDTENSDVIAYTHIYADPHLNNERVIRPEMLKMIYEKLLVEVNKKHDEGTEYKFSVVLADRELSHFPDYRSGLYNQFKFDPSNPYSISHFNFDEIRNIVDNKNAEQYKLSDTIYALPIDMTCKYFKPLKTYNFDSDNYDDKGMFNRLDLLNRIFGDDEEMEERVIDEIKDIPVEKLDMSGAAEEDDCLDSRSVVKSILTDAERRFIRRFELPIRILIAEDFVKGSKVFISKINIGLIVNGKFITTTEIYSPDNKSCITPDEFELLERCVTKFVDLAAKPSLVSVGSVNKSIIAKDLFNKLFAEEKLQRPEGVIMDDMIVYRGNIDLDEQFEESNKLMERANDIINARFQNTIACVV